MAPKVAQFEAYRASRVGAEGAKASPNPVAPLASLDDPGGDRSSHEGAIPQGAPSSINTRHSDVELMNQARAGNRAAFGDLVRRYQRRLHRLPYHFMRSTAEADDVVQETFVRAYQNLHMFDGRSEPFTWIYRITVNLSLNAIRKKKGLNAVHASDDARVESLLFAMNGTLGSDPGHASHNRRLAQALCDGIDELSETLRTTLILVCIDGLPQDEAGKVLGCPEGTVAWRVHEARRKLRQYLDGRGFGGEE